MFSKIENCKLIVILKIDFITDLLLSYLLFVSVVKIDLKNCKPGKFYDRIKQRLSIIKTTLIIKWQPEDDSICPSSIAKYFHERGYVVKECNSTFISHTEYSVKVPEVDFDVVEGEELVEWLGMISLGCDLENECTDNFINTYETPVPNTAVGQVKVLQWRGFYSAEEIQRLFDCIRQVCVTKFSLVYHSFFLTENT